MCPGVYLGNSHWQEISTGLTSKFWRKDTSLILYCWYFCDETWAHGPKSDMDRADWGRGEDVKV